MTALSLSGCVETLGRNIPQDDLIGDYLRALLWAILLSLTIAFAPIARERRSLLLRYWGVKVAISLGAMLVYEYAYGLDAFHYFAVAQGPFIWEGMEFGAGTTNMFHLAWLHEHLVPDSYHAMKISCSLIGLWAVYLFYRTAVIFHERESPRLFWMLALYPSVLFWSSILGKDPIVLLGIALYAFGVVRWAKEGAWAGIAYAICGLLIAMFIRTWLGPILLAPTALFIILRARSTPLKVLLGSVALTGFLMASGSALERFNVETSEELFMTANTISRSWSHGGSGQQISTEFTSVTSMLGFMPFGVVAALFRPLPFEILSPFGMLAGLENAFLIYLLVRAFRRSRWRDLKDPMISWMFLTVVTWATVYGFVSYQNLGSAVRFRLQVLPLMLIVLLHLAQWGRQRMQFRPTLKTRMHRRRPRPDRQAPLGASASG